jgi:uncharacterized protein YjdB
MMSGIHPPRSVTMSMTPRQRPAGTAATTLCALVAVAAVAACSLDTTLPCEAGNVTVSAPVTTITVGQTEQFSANYLYRNCSEPPVPVWTSSNTAVARVDSVGRVVGLSVGSTEIRVRVLTTQSNPVPLTVTAPPVGDAGN